MTADRAQLQDLAAPASESVDTVVTQNLAAVGALVGGGGLGMTRANQRAIGQDHRRGRAWNIEFWNGNRDFCVLDPQLDVSHAQSLTGRQLGFLNLSTVHENSIGRIAIPHRHPVLGKHDLTMRRGNCGMIELEIVLGAAPQMVHTKVEFDHPVFKAVGYDE